MSKHPPLLIVQECSDSVTLVLDREAVKAFYSSFDIWQDLSEEKRTELVDSIHQMVGKNLVELAESLNRQLAGQIAYLSAIV